MVKAIYTGSEFADAVKTDGDIGVVLESTSFYAEQGGQVNNLYIFFFIIDLFVSEKGYDDYLFYFLPVNMMKLLEHFSLIFEASVSSAIFVYVCSCSSACFRCPILCFASRFMIYILHKMP